MLRKDSTSPGTLTKTPGSTGSLVRMLRVLELFSNTEPVWSTTDLIHALDASRATGYRYIKTLYDAGFLTTVRQGYYTLGPRIIEMDLQLRQTDPLLLASAGVLEDLVENVGHSALLLTAFRDSVLCIGECRAPTSPAKRFSRGQRRSIFQGAGSKVILAHLPHHRLKTIYSRHQTEIKHARLGATWFQFRNTLDDIKKDGYLLTRDEFNPDVCGVAAPILTDHKIAIGSVGVAWDGNERPNSQAREAAVRAVTEAAKATSQRLKEKHTPGYVAKPSYGRHGRCQRLPGGHEQECCRDDSQAGPPGQAWNAS